MDFWTTEIARLPQAREALPWPLRAGELRSVPAARDSGRQLWHEARQQTPPDDRWLYWQRLAGLEGIRGAEVRLAFERASRGFDDLAFSPDVDRRVLVTGFDPFHLDAHIDQGNPSGDIALALDGAIKEIPGGRAQVRTCIVPVRYADFDHGLIEGLLAPLLPDLDMLITVSMGRSDFDLERFPGLRRSVDTLDNANLPGGGSAAHPVIPPRLFGPEYVEFSLPVAAMLGVTGEFGVIDNRLVTTLQRGAFLAGSLAELDDETAVLGSGGGYLSNEISYRAVNLVRQRRLSLPVGHIHTPRMEGYIHPVVISIRQQTERLITAALRTLS